MIDKIQRETEFRMRNQLNKIKELLKENPSIRNTYIALGASVVVLLVVILILVLSPSGDNVKVAEVRVTDSGFVPSQLNIETGTKVVWTNDSDKIHQIATNPNPSEDNLPRLESEILNKGQTYEYTFDDGGNFGYHDKIMPVTNGVIEVQ